MRKAESVSLRDKFTYRRDEFGIKPFYYTIQGDMLHYALEAKLLLPYLPSIETNLEAFKEYLTFQYCLGGKTLFKSISELLPAHELTLQNGEIKIRKYWELKFEPDFDHTQKYFEERTLELLKQSVKRFLDVVAGKKYGCYLSGGIDSSTIATLVAHLSASPINAYHGKFNEQGYKEDYYARLVARQSSLALRECEITANDFRDNIRDVIRCLDYPTMGPGAFPQYMTAKRANKDNIEVLFGGQGGDELFGGYPKYVFAYLEQCIKAELDETRTENGHYVATLERIIPHLHGIRQFKPLLKTFWQQGLFDNMDDRYYRLINRATDISDEVRWEHLPKDCSPYDTFKQLFNSSGVRKESYYDLMSRYDIIYGLPPMLHVEDRVSQIHGVESIMPFMDRELVEFLATIPANIKFKDCERKYLLREIIRKIIPSEVVDRKDKMGFPVPLTEWACGECKDFIHDIFSSQKALQRDLVDNRKVLEQLEKGEMPKYSRKLWGLLSLELWQQEFHDHLGRWQGK